MNPQAKLLWKEIRNKNCDECTLHKSAQTVCLVGDGPVPAKIMIVGEAPGYREDDVRRPFAGRSGGLLDSKLEMVGLKREDCFITNVCKCRPPDNATPNKTQQKACRHYLDDEIEAVKPEFILCLGNTALSVVRKSGILKHRGNWYDYGDAKVFPTVHPAAVLRNPSYEALFDTDLRAFARGVRGEEPAPPPKTILVRDKKTLGKMCEAILKAEAVAYDLETSGFDEQVQEEPKYAAESKTGWPAIATLSVSVKPGVAFVLPVSHPEAPWRDPIRALRIVGNALVYTNAKRVAHNAKFDDKWLQAFGVNINSDFDTMLAAHILDENRWKGLKVLAPMLLGVDAWSDIDLSEAGAFRAPLKKLARYNAKDTDYTLRLYYIFKAELLKPENVRSLRIFKQLMMPGSAALTDIEQVGLYLDQQRLKKRRIQVAKQMNRTSRKLKRLVGYEANWNSPQQLARIMFQELKLPIIDLTKGGAASTAESVLLRLRAEGHEIADLILEWRKWAKYDSTYLGNWNELQHKGRIRANYKLSGTVTGRLSSGKEEGNKGRGLNAQQIPRDTFIRSVIGAPEGWSFVEADFSQVELRIVAHYSQDPTMMRIFLTGGDIHLATAVKVTGKLPEHITKEERKKAKGVNFGYVFGMGWEHFIEYAFDSYEIIVSNSEAKDSRKAFFAQFTKLLAWHARQRRLVNNYGRVQSAIGRVRHLPDVYSEDKKVRGEAERQAINSPVQSLASDMMLLALIILHALMPPDEVRIVGTVHDSILFEIRDDVVDKWVPIIREIMEHLPLKQKFGAVLTVPIKVDISVGKHWGEGEVVA